MKGKVLWDYIEQEARKKFEKDDDWKLCSVDIIDDEIAKVTLRYKGVVPCDKSVMGLVVYSKADDCIPNPVLQDLSRVL